MTTNIEIILEKENKVSKESKDDLKEEFKDRFTKQGVRNINSIVYDLSEKYFQLFKKDVEIDIADVRLYIIHKIPDWIDEIENNY